MKGGELHHLQTYLRRGHKSCGPQQGLDPLTYGHVLLMLRQQRQVIHHDRPQGELLRPLHAFHGPLDVPRKNVFDHALAGLEGVRPQRMAERSDFHAAITMGRRASSGSAQFASTSVAPPPQCGIVIVGIAPHIAPRPCPVLHQQGHHRVITLMGHRQLRRPWAPDRAHGHGQRPCPAVPPAVPPGFASPGLSIKRAMGNGAPLALLCVPHAPAGLQRGAITRDGASMPGPGRQHGDQGSSEAAHQPRQAGRQGGQAALPGAAARTALLLGPQRASLAWQGSRLVETRQHGRGRLETANKHDDEGLQDTPRGRWCGPAPRPLGGRRWPGQAVDQSNQADKDARMSSHLRISMVSMCGTGDPTGSAVLWPGLARLF
jgi:hypothetical protein